MKVLVEKYRGFEISFDTSEECFLCAVTDDAKVSKSFNAVKKFVDDYIKDNNVFEPFMVRSSPSRYTDKGRIKITGIRKDGLFVGENKKKEKVIVSKYDEESLILDIPEDEPLFQKIALLEIEAEEINKKISEAKKAITAPTLKSLKQNYLPRS